MIAIHRDPIVVALTDVRRTMEYLRLVKPLPYAELALLALEELRLLRADCARRGN
jgi:hypothetical protein